jgi:hypothetical protein
MQGIERAYCDVCINATVGAWRRIMETPAVTALEKSKYGSENGKFDTLGLDAIPEITITSRVGNFDEHALIITEELDDNAHRRWPTDSDPIKQPLMFFSDPTDRSIELEKYIKEISKNDNIQKVGVLMGRIDQKSVWEEVSGEKPAIITGPSTSITCVRKGNVIFSVILNYVTGTICVACDIGIYWYELKPFIDKSNENITLSDITQKGKLLIFPSTTGRGFSSDDCKRFCTFLGKSGYRENFNDSRLFVEDPDQFLHHSKPPGPPRTLYLSEFQNNHGHVGFVLANGEKIGEWVPWLPFIKYAKNENGGRALRAFEIFIERPWTKNGMLMSTSKPYSIFYGEKEKMYLDMSRLRGFQRPSQFRCMLAVLQSDNESFINILKNHQYREVTNSF